MRILKTNTAVRIAVGPLVSYSDGYTLKTGLTVTGIEINMWHEHDDGSAPAASIDGVNPTASAGNNDMVELAHGYYDLEITAAQVNFLGRAKFQMFDVDQFLPYFEDWLVVPANVFDSIVAGSDYLDVNSFQLGGTNQTGRDVGASVLLSSGTGTGQVSLSSGTVTVGTSNDKTGYALTSAYEAAKTAASQTSLDTIDANVDAILVDTGTTIPATLAGMAASGAAAVWNYLRSAMTTANSIGKAMADWFGAIPAGATPFTATELSLCNNALLLLGNNAITAITDDTKAAKLCSQFYQQTVDSVLRAYTWNCATIRSAALTATTAPTFGFSYAFTLPTDCLRVLMIEDDQTIPFKVESGVLLTDESTCKISYIKRITPDDADSLLLEAISARLAATIAFPLTNSTSAAEAMWKLYEKKLDEAQSVDAFEGTAPQMTNDDWINSRG